MNRPIKLNGKTWVYEPAEIDALSPDEFEHRARLISIRSAIARAARERETMEQNASRAPELRTELLAYAEATRLHAAAIERIAAA